MLTVVSGFDSAFRIIGLDPMDLDLILLDLVMDFRHNNTA